MKIYFVRHGKTEWNSQKRLQGQTGDSPLLPEAYPAIARVHDFLAPIAFDKVLSSPSKRAVKTCSLLTGLDVAAVSTDERLAEWNFGDLEGMVISDAVALQPDQMYYSRNDLVHFDGSSFHAESVDAVMKRFDSLAEDCLASGCENILLVGHGASGTAGMRHLAGFPISELRSAGVLTNNSVTILQSQGDHFELLEWNKSL